MTSSNTDARQSNASGQKPVLGDFIGYQVRRLHYAFVGHWQVRFERLGLSISPVQGGILVLIDQRKSVTQKELSDVMEVEPPSMHESLRPLFASGLVERSVNPADRRAFVLSLTREGKAVVQVIFDNIAEHEREVLSRLDSDEIQTLNALLQKAVKVS